MSNKSFATLRQQLREAEIERDYYKSLVGAFSEGQVPAGSVSLQHLIFAQWGRRRQEELKSIPVLLRGEVN